MEDITNSRIFKLKERTLLWKFLIMYRPGKVNYFADCTSRNPVEASQDDESMEITLGVRFPQCFKVGYIH